MLSVLKQQPFVHYYDASTISAILPNENDHAEENETFT